MSIQSNGNRSSKRKKRSRIIKLLLILFGCGIITVQILILTGVIPLFKSGEIQVVAFFPQTKTVSESTERTAEKKTYMKYVFVGDSRYVGMSAFQQNGDVFLAKVGVGYDYLLDQMSNIEAVCDENAALIVGLGVNDVNYACEKYIAKLNELAEQLDCQIYFVSVNPVDEVKEAANGYSVQNAKIDLFNETIQAGLSDKIQYIDTNAYLKMMTYTTVDGLHYNEGTYQLIYTYIKDNL